MLGITSVKCEEGEKERLVRERLQTVIEIRKMFETRIWERKEEKDWQTASNHSKGLTKSWITQ